ncbi:unnamed protein product, partial [Ascophyllum nodosum]
MFDMEQLKGALSQLGVPISRSEAEEVMEYYSKRGIFCQLVRQASLNFFHAHLLQDAVRGAPSFLDLDQGITQRLLGSARSEASLLGLPKSAREETLVVKAFRKKLQEASTAHLVGGTPSQVLRDAFFKWDRESSGTVTSEQLRGALRSLNMRVSSTQAKEVEKFYAKRNSPSDECDYMALVRDVSGPDRSPLVHNIEKVFTLSLVLSDKSAAAAMAGEEGSGDSCGRSSSRPVDVNLSFTARPHVKPRNRLVERFKLRLRDSLKKRVRRKGGVLYSMVRGNFLQLDADASGKIDPVELKRAFNQMGVSITEEEAVTIVKYYDIDGSGEMSYDLLCREISPLVNPVLHFIEEVDVPKDVKDEIEVPRAVSRAVERVRAGVIDAGRRMEGPSSSKLLLPIFLRDVLMGTCMLFDRNDTGVLDRDKLEQVWRELKITLRRSEVAALVDWLGRGATDTVRISDLCNAVFGEGGNTTSRSSVASPRRQNHPLLPPPRPRHLQAQRSTALAMGKSISAALRSPARKCAAPPPLESKKVWNYRQKWPSGVTESRRGRAVPSLAAATRPEGPGNGRDERRCESVGVDSDGGCGRGVSNGAALPADGRDVVATEKMMIERRLKELQQEKANLLRRKKRMK